MGNWFFWAVKDILEDSEMKWKDKNITKLGFICAVMVIALHSYSMASLVEGTSFYPQLIKTLISYISHGLTTVAVPIFFFLSSYLLFKNVDSIQELLGKLRKRTKTLIIPYLCWNVLYFLFYILTGSMSMRTESMTMDYSLRGIIEGVIFHKYCFNLWFLLNLIVFTYVFSVPVFYLLKTKLVWIVWLLLLGSTFITDITLNIVLTENEISLFSLTHFLFWFLGAIWSKREMPCYGYKVALLGYFIISIAVMYIKESGSFSNIECILVLINSACFLLSAKLWIEQIKAPKHNMNMVLYGGAGFVQIIYTKLALAIAGALNASPIIVLCLYLFEVLISVVICYLVGVALKRYVQPLYKLFAGDR